jgi:hypothetical protein
VWPPSPQYAPWASEWQRELMDFPMGRHDDRVDSCSQCLHWLRKRDPVVNRGDGVVHIAHISMDRPSPFATPREQNIWDIVDGDKPSMGRRRDSLYSLTHPTYV